MHPNVVVYFNNTAVYTGAFVQATGNTFSGSAAASSGAVIAVGARAEGPWTDGATGGQEYAVLATVPSDCVAGGNGRFTGGGKQVEVGGLAKITRGLTIHCDLLLSNNLEINWDGGNNFHMLEHLETIACFDDPSLDQTPPKAPLDTLVGRGTGRFNGVDGYSIVFTLIDAGEPGRDDKMGFTITAPNGYGGRQRARVVPGRRQPPGALRPAAQEVNRTGTLSRGGRLQRQGPLLFLPSGSPCRCPRLPRSRTRTSSR